MSIRPIFSLALAFALMGCANAEKRKKKEADEKKKERATKLQSVAEEPAFKAFIGRLRVAVTNRDLEAISATMTPDFGYRWDTSPVGDNVFTYWDLNNSWPVLAHILQEKFVVNEEYLVAPPAVVSQEGYHGFRAGMRLVNGSWKFAYFVPGETVMPQ